MDSFFGNTRLKLGFWPGWFGGCEVERGGWEGSGADELLGLWRFCLLGCGVLADKVEAEWTWTYKGCNPS